MYLLSHIGKYIFNICFKKCLIFVYYRFANINLKNISPLNLSPETSSNYWDMMAYNNSKLCNVLFARQLAKAWQSEGISVFSLHPGNMVSTSLSRNWWLYRILFFLVRPFTKSLQQAAATTVYCATAQELNGVTGMYFNNCYRCEESDAAKDDELAQVLWNISIEMLNMKQPKVKIENPCKGETPLYDDCYEIN